MKQWSLGMKIVLSLGALFVLIQFIPFGRSHENPPVTGEPEWDSPRTRELFFRACADCHSNETKWPWYANVAPVSWLVAHDVDEGREYFNISEWNLNRKQKADDAAEEIEEGEMPLWFYVLLHPEADLNESEKQELMAGMRAMFNRNKEAGEREEVDDGH